MPNYTTRLGLTKPSNGENYDVDIVNANSDIVDSAIGAKNVTSTTLPNTPYLGQLVYETDTRRLRMWQGGGWSIVLSRRAEAPITVMLSEHYTPVGQVAMGASTNPTLVWSTTLTLTDDAIVFLSFDFYAHMSRHATQGFVRLQVDSNLDYTTKTLRWEHAAEGATFTISINRPLALKAGTHTLKILGFYAAGANVLYMAGWQAAIDAMWVSS